MNTNTSICPGRAVVRIAVGILLGLQFLSYPWEDYTHVARRANVELQMDAPAPLAEKIQNKTMASSSNDSILHHRHHHQYHLYQEQKTNVVVVDILSIGSQQRPELLVAQQASFGSHVSVRHFFNATEEDDEDPLCDSHHVNAEDTYAITRFCKRKKWDPKHNHLMHYLRNSFANIAFLKKKANPAGWMCAQRRPLHGLYKVLQQYTNANANANATIGGKNKNALPDYLIVMDDDTYFNMEQFQHLIVDDHNNDRSHKYTNANDTTTASRTHPSDPIVTAGCLVRLPIHAVNFTFGFGGYGTIFNKASLERLMEPIECPRDKQICARLQSNQIGENQVFQNGMTLIDLIQAFANFQPYRDLRLGNWTQGYCMHSDWVIGYFVNFYNVSRHTLLDDYYKNVAQSRMEEWHGSAIYRKPLGFCQNSNVQNCKPDDVTCHYMSAEAMVNFTNIVKHQAPERFR